jgi:hypothetical protein
VSSGSVASGSMITATLTLKDAYGNSDPTGVPDAGLIAFTSSAVGGTGSFGVVSALGSGVYRASFTGMNAGAVTLGAQVSGAAVASNASVSVSAGVASRLVFSTEPSGSNTAGVAFASQPVVVVQDAQGNTVVDGVDSTAVITLSIESGDGNLNGVVAVSAVAGIAKFTGLRVDLAGTKILKASKGDFTSSGGSAGLSVTTSIAVSASSPILSYAGASGASGTVGSAMSVLPALLLSNGAPVTHCRSLSPLPSGLSVDPQTCVISGTPTDSLPTDSYQLVATNIAGDSAPASVTITVSASVPSLSYAGATGNSGRVGSTMSISPVIFHANGAAITECSVTPALPSGLSLGATDCVIEGTPLDSSGATVYEVRAGNSAGQSAPAGVSISVGAVVPSLSYSGAGGTTGTAGTWMSVAPTVFAGNGAPVTDCSISPSLPSGLSLDPSTCVIGGTPSGSSRASEYQVRARNSAGDSTPARVTLTVSAGRPGLSYAGAAGTTGVVNSAWSVSPTYFQDFGSAITDCTVSPALPTGLMLDPLTCAISGTPTAVTASTSYAIQAQNSAGLSEPASVILEVNPGVPSLSYAGATGATGVFGADMSVSPTTLNSNGSAITGCSVTPALPAGLTLNTTTCGISGIPSAVSAAKVYSVTARNGVGNSSAAALTLSVHAGAPTLSFAGATGTTGQHRTDFSVSPTSISGNGAAITACAVTPALPAGLSVSATTCVISGTPTAAMDPTSFTVTATNSSGTGSAPVTIEIKLCPANYVRVPKDESVGTTQDFCVAKFEMKNVNLIATSQAALTPWVSKSQGEMKTLCSNLGTGYALINNSEWMTIARNLEKQGANWSNGAPNSGSAYVGHSDNAPKQLLPVVNENDEYDGTQNTSGNQRRTFYLSNGEKIWDFAGNAWEYVDWTVTPNKKAYDSRVAINPNSCHQFRSLNTNVSESDEMKPSTWSSYFINFDGNGLPVSGPWSGSLGCYFPSDLTATNIAGRGASYLGGAGIFALAFQAGGGSNPVYGFRCVYRQ